MSANLLHLKPCIEVKDGKMGVGHKYRGKLEKCYVQYIEERLKGRDDIDCHRIFITDSGCDEATWRELERVVRACQPFEEVIHTRAGRAGSISPRPRTPRPPDAAAPRVRSASRP